MKHKWHKEIKAWADGAEIQFKSCDIWNDIEEDETPEWNKYTEYRIKPQPKEPQYLYMYDFLDGINFTYEKLKDQNDRYIGKIKLEDESE